MNITNAQYQIGVNGSSNIIKIIVDGTEMYVPIDTANRHYAEIMRQVDAGELTIQEAD